MVSLFFSDRNRFAFPQALICLAGPKIRLVVLTFASWLILLGCGSWWAVLRSSGGAGLELVKECRAWMLFSFVVGHRLGRMKMCFRNQMQTASVLLRRLHRKHVFAGGTADHWPHSTHHPSGILRIRKEACGKRFWVLFFFLRGSLLWISLLSFCSWWLGCTSELEASFALEALGPAGKGSVGEEWGMYAGHLQAFLGIYTIGRAKPQIQLPLWKGVCLFWFYSGLWVQQHEVLKILYWMVSDVKGFVSECRWVARQAS